MIWLPRARKIADFLLQMGDTSTGSLENCGLTECSGEASDAWAQFIMERAFFEDDHPFKLVLPRRERVNAAVLGSYGVHNRVKHYAVKDSLQETIEVKISNMSGKKCVLAFNSASTNYCFETRKFSYDQLDELHKVTYADVFLVASLASDALFVFEEDAPMCSVSYATESPFAADFLSSLEAKGIFATHAKDWLITGSPGEQKLLEHVRAYFS